MLLRRARFSAASVETRSGDKRCSAQIAAPLHLRRRHRRSASRLPPQDPGRRNFRLRSSTLRTKRPRPIRLIGEPAKSFRNAASSSRASVFEPRRLEIVARGKLRLPAFLGELVPRADRQAIVAAKDAIADERPKLARDRAVMLDREVGDAAPRIEPVGRRKGVRRADVEAGPAGAAMIRLGARRARAPPW